MCQKSQQKMVKDVLYKVHNSVSCSCLFALEESFNNIGLTLQTTTSNRTILCRVENGKPCCNNAIDDYIFVGKSYEDIELGKRTIDCIVEFINKHIGKPVKLRLSGKSYHNDTNFYGDVIVHNEDVNSIVDEINL